MSIENKYQEPASDQDECKYNRLRVGEMTVVPLL